MPWALPPHLHTEVGCPERSNPIYGSVSHDPSSLATHVTHFHHPYPCCDTCHSPTGMTRWLEWPWAVSSGNPLRTRVYHPRRTSESYLYPPSVLHQCTAIYVPIRFSTTHTLTISAAFLAELMRTRVCPRQARCSEWDAPTADPRSLCWSTPCLSLIQQAMYYLSVPQSSCSIPILVIRHATISRV